MWVSFAAQLHEMGQLGPINPPNDRTLKVSPLELKASCRENTHGLLFDRQPNIKRQVSSNPPPESSGLAKKKEETLDSLSLIYRYLFQPQEITNKEILLMFDSHVFCKTFERVNILKLLQASQLLACVPDQLLTS